MVTAELEALAMPADRKAALLAKWYAHITSNADAAPVIDGWIKLRHEFTDDNYMSSC